MGGVRAVSCGRTRYDMIPTHPTGLTLRLDSNMARDAFATFIPISVESDARTNIIFDFFDLMAAIAAHGKTNGMGGRKLSRFAGWWAFEQVDRNNGFDGGYKSWSRCVWFHTPTSPCLSNLVLRMPHAICSSPTCARFLPIPFEESTEFLPCRYRCRPWFKTRTIRHRSQL